MSRNFIVVLVTFKNVSQARKIIAVLLERRLIACGNLISTVESSFWWEGKIQREKEVLVVMKTKKEKFSAVTTEIRRRHSYQVPEILALPVLKGNPAYLQWVQEVVI